MGVTVDRVDSGGQATETMSRPDGERRERGPLAVVLQERLTGGAAVVDASATRITQRSDGLVNERIGGEA